MNFVSKLDAIVDGYRAIVVAVFSSVVAVCKFIDPDAFGISVAAFLLAMWVLGAVWAWSVRDEDGAWTWGHFLRTIATRGWFGVLALRDAFPRNQLDLFRTLAKLSLATAVVANLVSAVADRVGYALRERSLVLFAKNASELVALSLVVCGVSAFVWWRQSNKSRKRLKDSVKGVASRRHRLVLDLGRNSASVKRLPAGLKPIGDALANWRPKKYPDEEGYAADLRRHLSRELEGQSVRREVYIRNEDRVLVGRIDLVIDDCVALELKRGLRGGQADRAVGQVMKYIEHWKEGPVLLVVCEAESQFESADETRRVVEATGGKAIVLAAGTS